MTAFQPVSRRSGVIASDSSTKRSVQMPVVSVSVSIGFAPSACVVPRMSVIVSVTTVAAGAAATRKTRTLIRRRMTLPAPPLIVLLQVEPGVERGDLVAVAVEHQRRPPYQLTDAALAALRPARMIDRRVDVGVEAV